MVSLILAFNNLQLVSDVWQNSQDFVYSGTHDIEILESETSVKITG